MQLTHLISNLSLPLLAKELIEQASRRRTYLVRVVYAILLFFAAVLFFYQTLRVGMASPLAALGRGRDMFMAVVFLQFAGVYLFMPAMTCSALTQEKERDSLQLLFLTRLGPWTILLEKLMSRVVPMLGFLLLSLPLLAFAYSLGGMSQKHLWTGIWLLVLATIQAGTISLACSAYFPTTVSAFVGSYVILAILFFGPGIWWLVMYVIGIDIELIVKRSIGGTLGPAVLAILFFPFFTPPYFALVSFPGGIAFSNVFVHSGVILGTSGIFLAIARYYVVRHGQREVTPPRRRATGLRWLPGPATIQRDGGPPVPSDLGQLPDEAPVAWRETRRHWFGSSANLLKMSLWLEVALAGFCFLLVSIDNRGTEVYLGMFVFLMWGVGSLVVAAQGAGLIAGERARQTLDVLCTTPLTGREIVNQKYRAVQRLIIALLLPYGSLALFGSVWKSLPHVQVNLANGNFNFDPALYFVCSCLAAVIYLPLVAWLSLLIGLAVRSQTRAIMGSMAVVVAWCAIPPVFIGLPLAIIFGPIPKGSELNLPLLVSPATVIVCNEFVWLDHFMYAPWLAVILNFTGYACVLFVVRAICLNRADHWLGRGIERSTRSTPPPPGPAEVPLLPAVTAGLPSES
jgi:ABC-type transport system involved in multi-copper enzyme maturation permease subunit